MRTLILIAAATIITTGCGGGGGGGGDPAAAQLVQPVEQAMDIWEGNIEAKFGSNHKVACLVTEGTEVRCLNDEGQVLFGYAGVQDDGTIRTKYTWANAMGSTPPGESSDGVGEIFCDFSPHEALVCELESEAKSGVFAAGTMWLYHKEGDPAAHTCLITAHVLTPQSIEDLWAPWTEGGPMVTIDSSGYAFAQDPATGCVFNGTAVMAFPYPAADKYTFVNAFRMDMLIEGCVDPAYTGYNGRRLRGLAYLDTTQLHQDTLVTTLVVRGPDGYAALAHHYRRQ